MTQQHVRQPFADQKLGAQSVDVTFNEEVVRRVIGSSTKRIYLSVTIRERLRSLLYVVLEVFSKTSTDSSKEGGRRLSVWFLVQPCACQLIQKTTEHDTLHDNHRENFVILQSIGIIEKQRQSSTPADILKDN